MQNNFKWWHAIVGYLAYILAFMSMTVLLTFTQSESGEEAFNVGGLFNVFMFLAGGVLCLLSFRLVSKNKISQAEYGIKFYNLTKTIGIGVVLGLAFWILSGVVESNSKTLKDAGDQVMNSFNIGSNFIDDVVMIIGVGLFAPVVEEIIFRGGIFNPIYQSLKSKASIPDWAALLIGLVISAALFAFSHGGEGQDAQLELLAVLGILAGLAMYLTKSIFGAILVHTVNNNVVLISTYYSKFGTESYGLKLIAISILCLLLCIPLAKIFGKILPKTSR